MANEQDNGYKITNAGAQVLQAPKQQPKSTATVVRGADLRSGK